jgi:hypothetical protein
MVAPEALQDYDARHGIAAAVTMPRILAHMLGRKSVMTLTWHRNTRPLPLRGITKKATAQEELTRHFYYGA